ncbi:MAG TPA: cysteine--tRNA ligase, partial [Gammaproteobacteria bacterium]|nr:cysteine--tRNA ligase [Gammaproteobacteria bacterium]
MTNQVIYNSLSRKKEQLVPITPGKLRMYTCGVTVYDYFHIGNARMLLVFDMVARYLRSQGWDLTYVRNITDIDDKIIKRAAENNETVEAVTARYTTAMHEDLAALGAIAPDYEPRATQYLDSIIAMIEKLINNGYAYQAGNGDVYYDVSEFADYGKLSGKRLKDLRAGARVDVDEAKTDPPDFVLWKSAKPGEPAWDSPWGKGRPGWHIECSAMSTDLLGEHFDIHGGGQDLIFPHHENEIAQSCGATHKPFVNVWMHNGFVQIDDEKMSKSLGNFFTTRDVLKVYQAEVVRYFMLSSHYRSPLNYSDKQLDNARASLDRLYLTLRDVPPADKTIIENDYATRFHSAMQDDFNTPVALAALFDLANEIHRCKDAGQTDQAAALATTLKDLAGILGLLQQTPATFLHGTADDSALSDEEIE